MGHAHATVNPVKKILIVQLEQNKPEKMLEQYQ